MGTRIGSHALLLLVVLCMPACSSVQAYPGAERPDSEVAVIVPDNPRLRTLANPLGAGPAAGGQIYVAVAGQRLGRTNDSFRVLPGTAPLQVIFRDHQTPVTGLTLETKAVDFPVPVEAGREYRIRGLPVYPPASSRITRTTDTTKYRVILFAQETGTGRVVKQMEVPSDRIQLVP
jgi:hypothetical protein